MEILRWPVMYTLRRGKRVGGSAKQRSDNAAPRQHCDIGVTVRKDHRVTGELRGRSPRGGPHAGRCHRAAARRISDAFRADLKKQRLLLRG
ncbi:hypothetical protein SKAU_G00371040 [Synaphobranchus kaupii]|uniref:Uncharacterized protein n=1 Tax=Synaphobranchus kaupii TaxID=118154 RepID=A0A9Q1EG13_SYNKA|nr:hypothetical protein SKAU_G00371040 [Synaphobranchus kaupii]